MKIITTAAIAAITLSLGACNSTPAADNQAAMGDNISDNLEAAADNATDPMMEEKLENKSDAVENMIEKPGEEGMTTNTSAAMNQVNQM